MPTELFHEGMMPESNGPRVSLNERYEQAWNSMLQATNSGDEQSVQEAIATLRAIEPLLPAKDH